MFIRVMVYLLTKIVNKIHSMIYYAKLSDLHINFTEEVEYFFLYKPISINFIQNL